MNMIVASSVVRLFLRMILIVDTFTFNMAIAIVSMIFLVIYTIVYKLSLIHIWAATILSQNHLICRC